MATGTAAFVDTSVLIAAVTHDKKTRDCITRRLERYNVVFSGWVARREFKYRLLGDAKYLHGLSTTCETMGEVERRLQHLPTAQQRKYRGCLELIAAVDEDDDDSDRLDRLRYDMRYLLNESLRNLDERYLFCKPACCAAGEAPVTERNGVYDLGLDKCSKHGKSCRIAEFLNEEKDSIGSLVDHLETIPKGAGPGQKSEELSTAERLGREMMTGAEDVRKMDPCTCIGDFLIALESRRVPCFYTMNGKESQHLCRALDQDLIVLRDRATTTDEVECFRSDAKWPDF